MGTHYTVRLDFVETERLRARVSELEDFVRHVRDNYDCDEDAHRYGTPCRCCGAALVLPAPLEEDV